MLYLIIHSEIWISLSLNSIHLSLYILGIWNITSIIAFNQLRIELFISVVTCNNRKFFQFACLLYSSRKPIKKYLLLMSLDHGNTVKSSFKASSSFLTMKKKPFSKVCLSPKYKSINYRYYCSISSFKSIPRTNPFLWRKFVGPLRYCMEHTVWSIFH